MLGAGTDCGLNGSGYTRRRTNRIGNRQPVVRTCTSTIVSTFYPRACGGSGGGVGCAGCSGGVGSVKRARSEVVATGNHCDNQFTSLSSGEGACGNSRGGCTQSAG